MIISRNFKNKYTKIPNSIIGDLDISDGAFRVYCYILSKPTDFVINNSSICKCLNIKSAISISKYLKQLIDKGYISRKRCSIRDNYIYIINGDQTK